MNHRSVACKGISLLCSDAPACIDAVTLLNQRVFLVQLYGKHEYTGKCRWKFLRSGAECLEIFCMRGHKTVKTATELRPQ